eukprot:gene5679-9500_t
MYEDIITLLTKIDLTWITDTIRKEILTCDTTSEETYSKLDEQINSEKIDLKLFQKLLKLLENVPKMNKEIEPEPSQNNKRRKLTMEKTETFYSFLTEEEFEIQSFVALLNLLIHTKDDEEDEESKSLAITSAQLYLTLLYIQDSKCYKIFNEITFMNAITLCKTMSIKNVLTKKCEKFFDLLGEFLGAYSLKNHEDLFLFIIEMLTEIKDYKILRMCLNDIHGDLSKIYPIILQQIFKTLNEKKSAGYAIEFIEYVLIPILIILRKTMNVVPQGHEKVLVILQHINAKFHQMKAAQRSIGSSVVSSLYIKLNNETKLRYLNYLTKLSKNTKSNQRLFTVEITAALVDQLLKSETIEKESVNELLVILLGRTSDKTNTVRTKALTSFVSVLEKAINDETIGSIITCIFSEDDEEEQMEEEEDIDDANGEIGGFIGQRLNDPSPGVRKAALQFIEYMTQLNPKMFLKQKYLNVFVQHSTDESLSNRKQTIISLSRLTEKFNDNLNVHKTFVILVLSLVSDVESSISEKSIDFIESLIIKKINEEIIWNSLSILETDIIGLLNGVLGMLFKKKSLSSSIVKHVQQQLKENPSVNGWMILNELSNYFPKSIDAKFILSEENEQSLSILSKISSNLPSKESNELSQKIFQNLNQFNVSPNLIHSYITILVNVNPTTNLSALINDCLNNLHNIVVERENYDELSLAKYLTTVGELMVITTLPKRIITLVQALVTDKLDISAQSKAHAFITLGKMSLCDAAIAKQSIPLLVTELEKAKDEVVKNNILIIMCDLCVKYTSLVDRYINKISECVNDESDLVRRTTAVLLTQLLAEDFIKWRPTLLFRFVSILSDPNDKVAGASEYAIDLLTRKNQNLLFNNFIECIFVLNGVKHDIFNKLNIKLKLEGGNHQKERFLIYQCLLQKLTVDQRLKIHGRFHTDVLIHFAENDQEPIDKYLVSDIIKILSAREMRFNKTSIANADEPTVDASEEEAAKGKLMTKILKKHIAENVIPVIIELKRTLEKQRSPLIKNLMEYLKLIMNDYKQEMKDVFAADAQLAKEIEFDLRKMKMDQQKFAYQSPFKSPMKSPMKSPFKVPSNDKEFKSPITPNRNTAPKLSKNNENLAKQLFQGEITKESENTKKRKRTSEEIEEEPVKFNIEV